MAELRTRWRLAAFTALLTADESAAPCAAARFVNSNTEPVKMLIEVPARVVLDAGEHLTIADTAHVELVAPRVEVKVMKRDVERPRPWYSHFNPPPA